MKIGLIVAMGKELKMLLPLMKNEPEITESDGFSFYKGNVGAHEVIVMQCGIGKVNAAVGTLKLIELYQPDCVINSGVAGGADPSMKILDLFVAIDVAYHDVWCGPGTEYGAASGYDVLLHADTAIIDKSRELLGDTFNVKYGLICSGDKFISTASEIREIKSHFPKAIAVDMESASIAQICTLKNVPFNIIRVISDTPGESDNISQYENFWNAAPAESLHALEILLS